MSPTHDRPVHTETSFAPLSAWPILGVHGVLLLISIVLAAPTDGEIFFLTLLPMVILLPGYFVIAPNTSRVLVLFGRYRGSVRTEGFYWTNPFTMKHRVSLRAHNFNSEKLKVNDLAGNPTSET